MMTANPTRAPRQKKQRTASARIDVAKARTALTFFKAMAFSVGIGLLVLVVEMILKYAFHNDALSWWPQPHGLLYVVYVAATLNLGLKMRWSILKMVGVVLAGTVPFLSFWIERKASRGIGAELAGR